MPSIKLTASVFSILCLALNCGDPAREDHKAESDLYPSALPQTLPDSLLAAAREHYQGGRFDSVVAVSQQARMLFEQQENDRGLVKAELSLALAKLRQNLFDECQSAIRRAKVICTNAFAESDPIFAELYNVEGRYLFNTRQADAAKESFLRELACYEMQQQPDIEAKAECLRILAVINSGQGEHEAGRTFMQRALDTFRVNDPSLTSKYAGELYVALGNMNFYQAKYDRALECYLHTDAIWKNAEDVNEWGLSNLFLNIGTIYTTKRRYAEALPFCQKSLQLCLKIFGEDNSNTALRYNNLGNLYIGLNDFPEAISAHKKTLEIRKRLYGERSVDVAYSYTNLGTAYAGAQDDKKALHYISRSIDLLKESRGAKNPDLPLCYNRLGEMYVHKGRYDKALVAYQQALCANVADFSSSDPAENPTLQNVFSRERLLHSLRGKAETLITMSAASKHPESPLKLALQTIEVAVALIDELRHGFRLESAKLFLADESRVIYEQGIFAAKALNLPEKAYLFAEKSRAGVLLESIAEADARHFTGIPDSLLDRENMLRRRLTRLSNEFDNLEVKNAQHPAADSVRIALFENKRAYEALITQFEADYPSYYNLKYRPGAVSLADLRTHVLDEQTALVEYFLGRDSLSIFVLTQDDLSIKTAAADSTLKTRVEKLRRAIVSQNFIDYTQTAAALYQDLILPVEKEIAGKNLLIIPDDVLCYLPFEVLLDKAPDNSDGLKDYRVLPYLLKKHAISYAYSATLLSETALKGRPQATPAFLGFVPSFSSGSLPALSYLRGENSGVNVEPESLPAAKEEVARIAALFKSRLNLFERFFSSRTKTYFGENATEQALKSTALLPFNIIHLATHGFIYEDRPALSGLLLANDSATEDGILYLREIYDLNLNAELVTLSACETGLGTIAHGEGPIGIARAFLYAGAKNLLVSQWKVSDKSTADLMVDFYTAWLSGEKKARALQQAKLRMIRSNVRFARPFYWAPFILIGK